MVCRLAAGGRRTRTAVAPRDTRPITGTSHISSVIGGAKRGRRERDWKFESISVVCVKFSKLGMVNEFG
jgi:hypothetical protein